jgi:hypothetical protein
MGVVVGACANINKINGNSWAIGDKGEHLFAFGKKSLQT